MPTLADLRVRLTTASRGPSVPAGSDEVLVVDSRSKLSPDPAGNSSYRPVRTLRATRVFAAPT